ncbi:hypothetical protein TSUD_348200 [Trifolium subterraneum]|nr:hypothetical protein TSUD_348200 [Trifolium subterraneum]
MADLPVESKNEELQDEESFAYAIQLCNSVVLSMALQSATELGVFEVLQKAGTDAKLSADEIASRLSCTNPDASKMLDRILALLASHSVIKCSVLPDQHNFGSFHRFYTMSPVAKFFAPNSDGVSLGPLIALHHDKIFLDSWSQLKDAIREGGVPFNRVHGTHAFQYPRIEHVGGDMFETVPKADAIFMKASLKNMTVCSSCPSHIPTVGADKLLKVAIAPHWILHDWSDEQCLKLLKNCYDAIPDDGKVIVLEAVLSIIPENNAAWKFAAQSDVLMMTQNPGGKERTEQEFMDLANGAGFSGIRYECYVHTFWVMEFFK